jgi:hypothetical protein
MKVCTKEKQIGIRVTVLIRILQFFSNKLKSIARRLAMHITVYFFIKSHKLKPAKYNFREKSLLASNYSATCFGPLGQFSTILKYK